MMRRRPTPDQIAYAEMPAGSAVVYTGGTIHAGGANVTDIPRRGAHLSYCLGWLRTEENNYLVDPAGRRGDAAAPGAGAARLRRARQHPARRRLPRHGAHAGPGRAAGPRRAGRLTFAEIDCHTPGASAEVPPTADPEGESDARNVHVHPHGRCHLLQRT